MEGQGGDLDTDVKPAPQNFVGGAIEHRLGGDTSVTPP